MDLLHAVVHHKTFGQGKVMDVDNDVIIISFSKPYGKKKFIFPTEYVGAVRHRESAWLDTCVGEIGQLRRRD